MPNVTDATSAVQFVMFFSAILMGISHIVQPKMWEDYFTHLHSRGEIAIITRTFTLELWPALIIVIFHQVWSGPGIIVSIYGWLLLTKCTVSILQPSLGMKSLKQAQRGGKGFIFAGLMLIIVGICAGWALYG